MFDKRAGSQRWSNILYFIVRREGFKYVLRNANHDVLKTKYRPSHLRAVSKEEQASLTTSPQKPSVGQQQRVAGNKRRRQRMLRALDAPPPRKRRQGVRPSTRRRRLRPRHS